MNSNTATVAHRPTPATGVPPLSGRTSTVRLSSSLSIELLRLSAPHPDINVWRTRVQSLCDRYPRGAVNGRLQQLVAGGFLTDEGTARTGWLTRKGETALARYGR